MGLAVLAGLAGIFLAAGSLGGTASAAMGGNETMDMVDFFAAGFNFLPSVLFFIGLAALALGWAPRLGKVVYVYLGYSFALNYFGNILDLPEWFSKTAIQSWLSRMPLEDFNAPSFLTIIVISIALMIIGYLGYHRRDLMEGA